jgi:hypothetical protein
MPSATTRYRNSPINRAFGHQRKQQIQPFCQRWMRKRCGVRHGIWQLAEHLDLDGGNDIASIAKPGISSESAAISTQPYAMPVCFFRVSTTA